MTRQILESLSTTSLSSTKLEWQASLFRESISFRTFLIKRSSSLFFSISFTATLARVRSSMPTIKICEDFPN